MHFSIPNTQDCREENGSSYVAYDIHINGIFHCTVRYRQLNCLHQQLCKELGASSLPQFPPKKLLPLSLSQIEERRTSLEKYILLLSQDPRVINNDIFNGFLVWAQYETQKAEGVSCDIYLDVFLMNGQKLSLQVPATFQTNDLLEKVCTQLNLPNNLVNYFALFLVKKDGNEINIIKKLQDFESPYITQKCAKTPHRIVLRKNYWDNDLDSIVMKDKVGLNLLYIQTVSDVEQGWILSNKEIQRQLASLQAKGAKKEYLDVARTLKYYGYLQFKSCTCDFPDDNTPVVISAGNKELNFRIESEDGSIKEGNFKITRMRCWRISTKQLNPNASSSNGHFSSVDTTEHSQNKNVFVKNKEIDSHNLPPVLLDLSFEYLMSRDQLRWVKVHSSQAVLMSTCLQGMVQELLAGKFGPKVKSPNDRVRKSNLSYMRRDGSSTQIILNHSGETSAQSNSSSPIGELSWKRLSERLSDFSFLDSSSSSRPSSSASSTSNNVLFDRSETNTVENNAFSVIGDGSL